MTCEATGKIRYGHLETATKSCAAMASKGNDDLTAYACASCGGFHIGHSRGTLVFKLGWFEIRRDSPDRMNS